nr:YfiR family protein [Plastoroseomonas hellenica]
MHPVSSSHSAPRRAAGAFGRHGAARGSVIRITLSFAGIPSWLLARGCAFGVALACVLCTAPAPRASGAEPLTRTSAAVTQVVLGILSYARWPNDPPELRFCVLADAAYANGLLTGTLQSANRPIRAQRIAIESEALTTCHVVYVGRTSTVDHRRIFARLAGLPILSISEDDPSCSVGSMFCLRVEEAQVSFQVNLDQIARSGLRIHPNVLRLGQRRSVSP